MSPAFGAPAESALRRVPQTLRPPGLQFQFGSWLPPNANRPGNLQNSIRSPYIRGRSRLMNSCIQVVARDIQFILDTRSTGFRRLPPLRNDSERLRYFRQNFSGAQQLLSFVRCANDGSQPRFTFRYR